MQRKQKIQKPRLLCLHSGDPKWWENIIIPGTISKIPTTQAILRKFALHRKKKTITSEKVSEEAVRAVIIMASVIWS